MTQAATDAPESAALARHLDPAAAMACLGGVAVLAMVLVQSHGFVYDDSFISLRYAMNLAEYGELAWNPGERVEGYTNFLFVLILAGLIELGADPVAAARGVAVAGALALAAATLGCLRAALPTHAGPAGAAAVLVLAGTVALPLWVLSGMETSLVAALVMLSLWAASPIATQGRLGAGRAILAGGLAALAYLTRMDAVVPVAGFFACGVLFGPGRFGRRLAPALLAGGVAAVAVALHLWWRIGYYGDIVPNTFHAKVGMPPGHRLDFGVHYLARTLAEAPLLSAAVLLGLALLATGLIASRVRPLIAGMLAAILAQFAYVLWSGGDHLPAGRFIVAALGPAAVALGLSMAALPAPWRLRAIVALVLAAAAAATVVPVRHHGGAEAGLIVGAHLRDTEPEGTLIALNVAGATPFIARNHRYVDMLGLNDARIARRGDIPMRTAWQRRPGHAKGDGAYVLSREPDIILIGGAFGAEIGDALFLGEVEMAELPEFDRCYRMERTVIDTRGSDWAARWGYGAGLPLTFYRRVC